MLEEYTFSWFEDRTYTFLNTLKPYIEEGIMEYRSIDDDHHWRYIYNPVLNKWKEKIACTSYGFEGYTVRKSKIKELVNKNIDQIIEDRF